MTLAWFDAAAAQDFGKSLAKSFIDRLSPAEKASSKKFEGKAKEALAKMAQQIATFRSSSKLNFYKKAKLGNAFKWALREAGYDQAYTDELTEWLMLQLQ